MFSQARRITTVLTRRLVALAAPLVVAGALLAGSAAPAEAHHQSRVTLNVVRDVSQSQLFSMAKGYAQMTSMALSACGSGPAATVAYATANLRYALRLTPFGTVSAGWISGLYYGFGRFTGVSFCDIAYKASQGAAWAAYWGSRGGARTQMYVFQEDRHWAPDVCHTSQSFNGAFQVWDLKTSSMGRSCPS